jgi:glycosyltransferase involved in cell wall biosynthesis
MNILMIAPQPFFSPRGTPLSVYYRTVELSKLGNDIDLLTYPLGQDVDIPRTEIIRSWNVPFIHDVKIGPSVKKLMLDGMLFVKAVVMLLKKEYDVVFAHEEAVFFALIFKYLFGIKYIYDMHSSLPQQLRNFNFTKFGPLIKVFNILENLSLKNASAIITICQDLKDRVIASGCERKHELIQNTLFYTISYADELSDVELGRIINTTGKKIVLYAGSFEPYQGLDMYLESIQLIARKRNDIMFIFIGGSPEQVLSARNKSEGLGITDQVIFTGIMEVNLVKKFVQNAHVLVSPRLTGTNTPLKIYEYMASGVPIVATDLITHTQELDESSAFLQEPEADEFARGILFCIDNRAEALRRSKNAYDRYHSKYGEDNYAKKLAFIVTLIS